MFFAVEKSLPYIKRLVIFCAASLKSFGKQVEQDIKVNAVFAI